MMNKSVHIDATHYQRLIAKCWSDPAFKARLLAEPAAALKLEGWELPDGLTVTICEDTDQVVHLTIPAQPTDLTDDDMAMVAGGRLPPGVMTFQHV